MPNIWAKTRPVTNPYLEWTTPEGWMYRVLKAYQTRAKERANPFARLFCQVVTPYTGANGDLGDVYIRDLLNKMPSDSIVVMDKRIQAEEPKKETP